MKKTIGIILVLISTLFSCDDNNCIQGDGSAAIEERDIGFFNTVNNNSTIDIIITDSLASSTIVELLGEQNIIEQITTILNGNVIEVDNNSNCLSTTRSTEIRIYQTNISGINNSGTGNINGMVSSENITISNNGTRDINLSGMPNNGFNITNEGTGEVNVELIESQDITVRNSGTGDIYVNAISSLSGSLSGTGNVYYKGNPAINVTATGTGEVIDNN